MVRACCSSSPAWTSSSSAMLMYSGALEHLRVVDVGDDRLVLAGQVLVEQLDQLLAGDGGVGHRVSGKGGGGHSSGTVSLTCPPSSVTAYVRIGLDRRAGLDLAGADVELRAVPRALDRPAGEHAVRRAARPCGCSGRRRRSTRPRSGPARSAGRPRARASSGPAAVHLSSRPRPARRAGRRGGSPSTCRPRRTGGRCQSDCGTRACRPASRPWSCTPCRPPRKARSRGPRQVSGSRKAVPTAIRVSDRTFTSMWYVARCLAELFGGTTAK